MSTLDKNTRAHKAIDSFAQDAHDNYSRLRSADYTPELALAQVLGISVTEACRKINGTEVPVEVEQLLDIIGEEAKIEHVSENRKVVYVKWSDGSDAFLVWNNGVWHWCNN